MYRNLLISLHANEWLIFLHYFSLMKMQMLLNTRNCLNGSVSGCPYKSQMKMCKHHGKCFHTHKPLFCWSHAVSVKTYRNTWEACLAGSQEQQLLMCQSLSRSSRNQLLKGNNHPELPQPPPVQTPCGLQFKEAGEPANKREEKLQHLSQSKMTTQEL